MTASLKEITKNDTEILCGLYAYICIYILSFKCIPCIWHTLFLALLLCETKKNSICQNRRSIHQSDSSSRQNKESVSKYFPLKNKKKQEKVGRTKRCTSHLLCEKSSLLQLICTPKARQKYITWSSKKLREKTEFAAYNKSSLEEATCKLDPS